MEGKNSLSVILCCFSRWMNAAVRPCDRPCTARTATVWHVRAGRGGRDGVDGSGGETHLEGLRTSTRCVDRMEGVNAHRLGDMRARYALRVTSSDGEGMRRRVAGVG